MTAFQVELDGVVTRQFLTIPESARESTDLTNIYITAYFKTLGHEVGRIATEKVKQPKTKKGKAKAKPVSSEPSKAFVPNHNPRKGYYENYLNLKIEAELFPTCRAFKKKTEYRIIFCDKHDVLLYPVDKKYLFLDKHGVQRRGMSDHTHFGAGFSTQVSATDIGDVDSVIKQVREIRRTIYEDAEWLPDPDHIFKEGKNAIRNKIGHSDLYGFDYDARYVVDKNDGALIAPTQVVDYVFEEQRGFTEDDIKEIRDLAMEIIEEICQDGINWWQKRNQSADEE